MSFDAGALALVGPTGPREDGFLSAPQLDAGAIRRWCDATDDDALFGLAREQGAARGEAAAGSLVGGAGQQAMVLLAPATPHAARHWHLALARAGAAFDEREQQLGLLALRQLQARFDLSNEPQLARLLVGHDDRLLHADAATDARMLAEPSLLPELTTRWRKVVEQRWPEREDDAVHDLALRFEDQPVWVRVRQLRAAAGLEKRPWHLEMRPLTETDMPAVGLVDDPRVARALGYLSDRYAQSPTLGELADAMQVSPFHFHRLFVRQAGISPKHYLLRTQLTIAKWLLRTTRMAVGDIATATGFASHGHFTATFHRHVGASPSTYREGA